MMAIRSVGVAASEGGGEQQAFAIDAAASLLVVHDLPFVPRVTITDPSGNEVDTDVTHTPGQTALAFATPFTGTLYLG